MTENTTEDQSVIYRDYFETVKAFNLANTQYQTTADEITNQRQKAIQRAIEIHVNPLLRTMRSIQIGSIIVGVASLVFMCCGIGNFDNIPEIFGPIIILALGFGMIALILFGWSSTKLSGLNKTRTLAVQKKLPDIPQ